MIQSLECNLKNFKKINKSTNLVDDLFFTFCEFLEIKQYIKIDLPNNNILTGSLQFIYIDGALYKALSNNFIVYTRGYFSDS